MLALLMVVFTESETVSASLSMDGCSDLTNFVHFYGTVNTRSSC